MEFLPLIDASGSRIREKHQPSDFKLQDAAMSINLDASDIVRMFQVRATAELKRELDEVKWWEDRVRRGLVKREHAERYIQASKRIIKTKRHVLDFPEFPC
jgi:predicted ATPase